MIEFQITYPHHGTSISTVATICPDQITAVVNIPGEDDTCVVETEFRTYQVRESYSSVLDKIDDYIQNNFYDQMDALSEMDDDDDSDLG